MDEKVQTKTPPAYGCLSLGFHFSVAVAVPGGGFVLPPLSVLELFGPDFTYFA